ncbi:V-type proton ATPase subunit F [Plasmodiophora brassicae]|nr:hypothetical protein PBRA_001410 [Plasmodiophora brassicae]
MCAAVYGAPSAGALVAVIGDEDTVTGFLLTGIGDRTNGQSNFLVVNSKTSVETIEQAFKSMTSRKDIAMILINQHVADQIRHLVNQYDKPIPTVLEIPSKDVPYDENKDSVMKRVKQLMGRD